jgi:hypothetical protein
MKLIPLRRTHNFRFFLLLLFILLLLPTPVEGIFGILSILRYSIVVIYNSLFYSMARERRDCSALLVPLSTERNITTMTRGCRRCERNLITYTVGIYCSIEGRICITPSSDPTFCTPPTNVFSTYEVHSNTLPPFASTSTVSIQEEISTVDFDTSKFFQNRFTFQFIREDETPSSKLYTSCTVTTTSIDETQTEPIFISTSCYRCDICDNGIDFQYDCSNVDGIFVFHNGTNTTEILPGPKVETCFPIINVFPTF